MEELIKLNNHFKRVRLITIISLISLATVSIVSMILNYTTSRELSTRIYVVDKNEQFEAMTSDLTTNRPVEIKYHVTRFHELFFTLSPDADQIEDNMKKAFYLSDQSVKIFYDNLKEQNFYNDIIQGNVVQTIFVDSVTVNTSKYPYTATTFSKILQTRATNKSLKNMITTCTLEDSPRSIKSPNGLFMRNFKLLSLTNAK